MEHEESGEAPSSMKQGVVKLACQVMALCVCRVKREELQAHHESYVYFSHMS